LKKSVFPFTTRIFSEFIHVSGFNGSVIFLKVPSIELYFVKCLENVNLYMSGLPLNPGQVYVFPVGSTIKTPTGQPIYYSDIVARFLSGSIEDELSFHAKDLEFQFSNGSMGLRGITIEEGTGKLVGIMTLCLSGLSSLMAAVCGLFRFRLFTCASKCGKSSSKRLGHCFWSKLWYCWILEVSQ
jgi:hypothetical protein